MAELPDTGDKVKWDTPQGETHGTVEKIVTWLDDRKLI